MHSTQNRGVRRAVIKQDNRSGQRERPRRDLQQEDKRDADPDEEPPRGRGGRGRRRQDGQIRGDGVRDREEDQEGAEGAQGAESGVHGGVQEQLEGHAQHPEDRGRDADGGGGHAEAAGESEGEMGGGGEGGVAGGGEE